jgi:hypothetical protein
MLFISQFGLASSFNAAALSIRPSEEYAVKLDERKPSQKPAFFVRKASWALRSSAISSSFVGAAAARFALALAFAALLLAFPAVFVFAAGSQPVNRTAAIAVKTKYLIFISEILLWVIE